MFKRFSRILVIDDSVVMLKIVKNMLLELGLENVYCVSNSLQAQGLMQTERFQLIVSDWQMEPVSGLEMFRQTRGSRLNAKTPFLIMTGHAIKFASIARENGNLNYISKPFDTNELAKKLQQVTTEMAA